MEIPEKIVDLVRSADSKALATDGPNGLNVVPVSTVFVEDGVVRLVNYFLDKTAENIQDNSSVSLVCWKDNEGYQLKGECEYKTEPSVLEPVKEWAAEEFPERTVSAILEITPQKVYKVAASPHSGHQVWPQD